MAFAPRGFKSFRTSMPIWLREKLFQKRMLRRALAELNSSIDVSGPLVIRRASPKPRGVGVLRVTLPEQAVILTLDGVGEWATTSASIGNGNRLEMIKEIHFPHSLGLLYSAFTHYAGFKVNSGEYKLMGLAPYGSPRFRDLILDNLIDLKADGSFLLDLRYFDYCVGLQMTNAKFDSAIRRTGSKTGISDYSARYGSGGLDPVGCRRSDTQSYACASGRNRMQESLSRRRSGA